MATPSKTPRKTPQKQRNIVLEDDEKLLDEGMDYEKKTVSRKNRRKSEISHRNISEEILFFSSDESDSKLKKNPTKKKSNASSTKFDVSCIEECPSTATSEEDADKMSKLELTPKKPTPKKLRPKTPSSKALENIAAESSPSGDVIESNARKSGRIRSPTKRFIEKDGNKPPSKKPVLDDFSDTEFDSDSTERERQRPTTLFGSDDVEGQHLFGFKTPKKKHAMLAMAAKTPKSAGSSIGNPKTPKSARNSVLNPKTPHHLRIKTKKRELTLCFSFQFRNVNPLTKILISRTDQSPARIRIWN